MILYIYKTNDSFSENLLNNKTSTIIIQNHDAGSNEIKGIVDLNDYKVEFIYKFNSNFLFLFANSKYEKRKAFNILYEISSNGLTYFKPDPYKEHEMICSSKDNWLTVKN